MKDRYNQTVKVLIPFVIRERTLVFCANATFAGTDTAYVFTTGGVQLRHWTEHHRPRHGDMTVGTDGSEVYVSISNANPD